MTDLFPDLPALAQLGDRLSAAFHEAAAAPAPSRRFALRRPTAVVFAALALAVVGTGALAATNVIHFGRPAHPTSAFSNPHRGAGAILPHTVRLLPVESPDPVTGPPWGMRVLSTTRGVGCIQVGRLLRGKLGLLGTAGAFGNDGLFHVMPARSAFSPPGCTLLDRNGRIFLSVFVDYLPASGTAQSCFMQRFFKGGPPPQPACRLRDVRTVAYGLLGPAARSVTYSVGGVSRTVGTAGPEGAYLIVLPAIRQGRSDAVQANTLPSVGGRITAIAWRDGSVCHLPAHGHPFPASACTARGYVPPATTKLTPAQVAAPVRVRPVRSARHGRRHVVQVSFEARVPVTSARSAYVISWTTGGMSQPTYAIATQGDVRAGQTIAKRLVIRRPGLYRGTVAYTSSSAGVALPPPPGGPGQETVLVGRFTIRVP